jgi:hypothetical protein
LRVPLTGGNKQTRSLTQRLRKRAIYGWKLTIPANLHCQPYLLVRRKIIFRFRSPDISKNFIGQFYSIRSMGVSAQFDFICFRIKRRYGLGEGSNDFLLRPIDHFGSIIFFYLNNNHLFHLQICKNILSGNQTYAPTNPVNRSALLFQTQISAPMMTSTSLYKSLHLRFFFQSLSVFTQLFLKFFLL